MDCKHLYAMIIAIIFFAQMTNISAQGSVLSTQASLPLGRLLTPEEGCGMSKVATSKIIGGTPAKPGAFPWMALLGYKNPDGEILLHCGASLITSRHVLTASHCIRDTLSFVRLGEHNTSTTLDGQHQDIKIIRIKKHPHHNDVDKTSDIAILTLERDVEFSDRIRPICLPENNKQSFLNTNPLIAGWGFLRENGLENGKLSDVLMQVQLPVIDNEQCEAMYRVINKYIAKKRFSNIVLCAGHLAGGQDSCNGDSGGPLMLPIQVNDEFPMYQIGVVSYGIGCGRPNMPGVYTRVTEFIDWIKKEIKV